jgi:outer membrane protein assembly factor BamB
VGRPLRAAAAACSLAVVAGCSSGAQPRHPDAAPAAKARPKPAPRPVHVYVFDGDLGAPVRGARVRVGPRHAYTNARGLARLRPRQRRSLPVYLSAPGYDARVVRIDFRRRPKAAVLLYRRALQWPIYGVSADRTQTQPNILLRPPFRVVWSRGLAGLIEFPAVVSDGVAYIANAWGSVRALRMSDGALLWRHDIPNGEMASSPAVDGERLIVHGMDGHVWVLDRANGRVLWSRYFGSSIESSPIVRDGVDYFGTWGGTVYALDLDRRELVWTHPSGYKITSSASLSGSTLYIGDYGGRLLALDPANGRLRWSGGVNGRIYGTPAVAAGRIFVPSSDGNSLTAFSRSGAQLWRIDTGGYVYSSPAVWNSRVYFGSYSGVFYCVQAATGRILWTYASGGSISGAPAVVDGIVYFSNFRHRVYALDARSGRLVFGFPDGAYVPVSGNGGRLLLHGYSRLYAVEPRR